MAKSIDSILELYSHSGPDDLIPILQAIQDELGCLNEEAIVRVGEHLKIPTSKIYGLATFYNQFRFERRGKFHIRVCRGTSCRLRGSNRLIAYIEKRFNVKNGQSSRDGMVSFEILSCLGGCEHGPVISINDEFYTAVTLELLADILDELIGKEQ